MLEVDAAVNIAVLVAAQMVREQCDRMIHSALSVPGQTPAKMAAKFSRTEQTMFDWIARIS